MSGGAAFAIVALALLVAIGISILGFLAAKKRREDMAALAAAQGWTYVERDDRWTDTFTGSPFGLGHNRQAKNVLAGDFDGRPFVAFDYVYYTTQVVSNGKTTTTRQVPHPYGIVAVDMGAAFPALEVSPENFVERIVGRLTDHDIELESEDFNRAFTVSCPDRKFASDVLHPRMMEMLMQWPDAGFRFDGAWIIDVETGTVALEGIEPRLRRVDAIVDQVPDFVWKQVKQ